MSGASIKEIMNIYKKFIKSDKFIYGEEGKLRGKELALEIDGEFFGGHTKTALLHKLSEYDKASQTDDIEKVKEHTEIILKRNSTLSKEFDEIEDEDREYFHWLLLKAEVENLNRGIKQQKKYFKAVKKQEKELVATLPKLNGETISISKLTKKYIEEKSKTKEWGAKNEKDIKFVLGILDEYFSPKTANQLTRNDFVKFRDVVLPKLPVRMGQNAFKDKSIKDIIKMKHILTKDKKEKEILHIGKTTINKHIGRVNQVYAWAADEAGILNKNFCSKLRYAKPKTAEEKKKAKAAFNTDDLKRWFEISPHFTSELKQTLTDKPEHIFIPLVALYLGARNAELTQLHYRDIKEIDGIWCINITGFSPDNTERKRVKGENSLRTIPIAQGLLDVGFLKYVQKRKNKLLFPQIKYTSDQEPLFTNEINLYIREHIRQGEERKTFLSFRHMVNQKLKNTKTELYIINDITGHSDTDHDDNNIDIEVYGDKQMPLKILQETIDNSLVYDEIDFSHIKEEIHRRYK